MAAFSTSMIKDLRDRTGLGMMECKRALTASDGDINKAIDDLRKSSGIKAAKKAGRIAADGIIAVKMSEDDKRGVMIEVNTETDFAARDNSFIGFVNESLDKAFDTDKFVFEEFIVNMEEARHALVQKIGENISIRRVEILSSTVVGNYIHSNKRIGVMVALEKGDTEVAKDVAMHIAASNPQVVEPEDMPDHLVQKEKEIFIAQAKESGKSDEIINKMINGRINKFLSESSLLNQPFVKNPEMTVGELVKNSDAKILSFSRFEVGEGIEKIEVDFATEVAAQVNAAK
ncbi:MAG: translation elongation factor Ts [Gammaproteobacteria bacterium]|jgi:elongation factor Ts|nr:translation elongation factor Ts [Gammaproteobacteria bacterium]MDC0412369.1 translation elongation factor Ts [Porticoccus sp.]MDC1093860.1 translation elongation factor Ts [Porticoccus sp.]